jgi:cytochrome c-type biogenesis protein CcmH/NrfG
VFSAPNNLPEPEARILYVRDLGDQNRTLIERFADRAPYRLFLGEGRRYELERLSGDEATKRMVQDRLRDARVHLRKLELREGIELIQQATRIDPGSVEAHLLLGWAYEQGRVSRGAEMAYRKALELDPSKAEHWFFLGRFLGRANRLNEALPLLEKAAELDPRSRDIQAALAQVRSGTPPP